MDVSFGAGSESPAPSPDNNAPALDKRRGRFHSLAKCPLFRAISVLTAGGRSHFGGEVRFFLFDAITEQEANKANNRDGRADTSFGFLDGLFDGQIRVHHEGLREQHDFFVELTDTAFDHLFDDVVGTA